MTDVEVLKKLGGGVTEKVVKAVKLMKFLPAEKDGQLVSTRMIFQYNYNIK